MYNLFTLMFSWVDVSLPFNPDHFVSLGIYICHICYMLNDKIMCNPINNFQQMLPCKFYLDQMSNVLYFEQVV